jgi:hypothetical protein
MVSTVPKITLSSSRDIPFKGSLDDLFKIVR